jgi:hypothetical protein
MEKLNIIITGTTGMVGEGVLLECLSNPQVSKILSISRKPTGISHEKLKEHLVPDFFSLTPSNNVLTGYDACFFCAGVSSVGMNEPDYTRITHDATLHMATILSKLNPPMTFIYVSGTGTDSTEKGRSMWARVKGRTENDLLKLPFKRVYNFRPGLMKPMPEQQRVLAAYKYLGWWMFPLVKLAFPNSASTLQQVARAMIKCATTDVGKSSIEVRDINGL